jgi:hypothetical protein
MSRKQTPNSDSRGSLDLAEKVLKELAIRVNKDGEISVTELADACFDHVANLFYCFHGVFFETEGYDDDVMEEGGATWIREIGERYIIAAESLRARYEDEDDDCGKPQ